MQKLTTSVMEKLKEPTSVESSCPGVFVSSGCVVASATDEARWNNRRGCHGEIGRKTTNLALFVHVAHAISRRL